MRRYYTSRKRPGTLSVEHLYVKLLSLYLLFRDKDYFEEKARIYRGRDVVPEEIKHEATLALTFDPFPIPGWMYEQVTEEHVFESIEFLYDYVSKPVKKVWRGVEDEGYYDWIYDENIGRTEFRETANSFLADYPPGYELNEEGEIVELGEHGLRHILSAEIVAYDELHVDSKVRNAISKWRRRHSSLQDKKEAIRELADVFEWLKKTKKLQAVLTSKDESALFDIANNFAIRHHNPGQKANYDQNIWFSWIFHFYLATYHAAVRLLIKNEKEGSTASSVKHSNLTI